MTFGHAQGPLEPVYKAALSLGLANQLTNILRDVGEDAQQRNRLYVPLDELAQFGIAEEEVCTRGAVVHVHVQISPALHVQRTLLFLQVMSGMFAASTGKIDDRWRGFMKFQIARARQVFNDAEAGVNFLDKDARWPVW